VMPLLDREGSNLRQRRGVDPEGDAPDDRLAELSDHEVANLLLQLRGWPVADQLQPYEDRKQLGNPPHVRKCGGTNSDTLILIRSLRPACAGLVRTLVWLCHLRCCSWPNRSTT